MEYCCLLCLDFSKYKDDLLDQKRASLFSSYLVRTIPLPSQGVVVETKVYVIETLGKIETAVVIIFLLWNRVLINISGSVFCL